MEKIDWNDSVKEIDRVENRQLFVKLSETSERIATFEWKRRNKPKKKWERIQLDEEKTIENE